jgi:hypothetical protein
MRKIYSYPQLKYKFNFNKFYNEIVLLKILCN